MSARMPTKAAPRYAWIALLVVSVLALTIGVGDFFLGGEGDPGLAESMTGMPWEEMKQATPRVVNLMNHLSRILGAWLIGFSVMGIGVSLVPFRRGERWAWYLLWSFPLTFLLVFVAFLTANRVPGGPTPPGLLSAPGLFAISALALLLSFRAFFTKSDGPIPSAGAEYPNDGDSPTS